MLALLVLTSFDGSIDGSLFVPCKKKNEREVQYIAVFKKKHATSTKRGERKL